MPNSPIIDLEKLMRVPGVDEEHPLKAEDQQIAEIAVIQGSHLRGKTFSEIRFADRYGIIILAIHRAGKRLQKGFDSISNIRMQSGDILLVQGPREQIADLKKEVQELKNVFKTC